MEGILVCGMGGTTTRDREAQKLRIFTNSK